MLIDGWTASTSTLEVSRVLRLMSHSSWNALRLQRTVNCLRTHRLPFGMNWNHSLSRRPSIGLVLPYRHDSSAYRGSVRFWPFFLLIPVDPLATSAIFLTSSGKTEHLPSRYPYIPPTPHHNNHLILDRNAPPKIPLHHYPNPPKELPTQEPTLTCTQASYRPEHHPAHPAPTPLPNLSQGFPVQDPSRPSASSTGTPCPRPHFTIHPSFGSSTGMSSSRPRPNTAPSPQRYHHS